MDLATAGIESTASMAPSPKPHRWLETIGHPWRALSLGLFFALHRVRTRITVRRDARRGAVSEAEALLGRALSTSPCLETNDGVAPLRSQLRGNLVWAGHGDHFDVLGHYRDDRDPAQLGSEPLHRDWLTSGSDSATPTSPR